MISESEGTPRICLSGDWSMSGVAERFPILVKYFSSLIESETCSEQQNCTSSSVPEIDLAGVTDFDACGCQLLAQFIRNLKHNGINTQLTNISDTFRSKIQFLGFERELNLPL